MRYTTRTLLVLMAVVGLGLYVYANGPWWWSWQRSQARREFDSLEHTIVAGLSSSTNDIDSTYFKGQPGADATLRLLEGVGWTNKHQFHGESIEQEYGSFTRNGDRLFFSVHTPNFEGTGWASHLVIRWGDRIYMIDDENLDDFERDCRKGLEPRTSQLGRYYLRQGDHTKPVFGNPIWPEGIARQGPTTTTQP